MPYPRNSRSPSRETAAPSLPSGLKYVSDATLPGITRERGPEGFVYHLPDGSLLRDEAEIQRIRKLAIPPAYTDVWICPLVNGHLQATGRDARGRKQYRYHTEWNALRNADKFGRLEAFGRALPQIRRRVMRDLRADKSGTVSYPLVLATLVRLLDTTFIRVGNEAYARENRSYGLTTLRNRHAGVSGRSVRLSFRGKHGVRQEVKLHDPLVVRVVRRCKHLPGQELFQYEENGEIRGIGSGDVNDYISEAASERFTAKDFRTWHGTVEALELMRMACSNPADEAAVPFNAKQILEAVAHRLGNTVAVCRKAYIHPAVLALGERLAKDDATSMAAVWQRLGEPPRSPVGLSAAERRLLAFLAEHERLRRAEARATTARKPRKGSKTRAQEEVRSPDATLRNPGRSRRF